jgi:polyisoprenoid-binding protein YceI
MTRKSIVLGAATAVVAAGIAGGALFFNRSAPPPLDVDDTTTTRSEPTGDGTGRWEVADGSEAGYRVREKLARLPARSDAVGRTTAVTGELTVAEDGDALVARDVSIEVDLTQLRSDEQRRDNRIRTQGLESERYPTATFVSAADVVIPDGLSDGQEVEARVPGRLTIHGVTSDVVVPVTVALDGGRAQVAGSISFPMADFDIEPPSIANIVTVDPDATLEFRLVLEPSA